MVMQAVDQFQSTHPDQPGASGQGVGDVAERPQSAALLLRGRGGGQQGCRKAPEGQHRARQYPGREAHANSSCVRVTKGTRPTAVRTEMSVAPRKEEIGRASCRE